MWGDKYQVLVTVHLNTDNVHCHFVVNPVSFKDGAKFKNKIGDHKELCRISDAICREHGLSVLENSDFYSKGKKKEYWVHKAGKKTQRDYLREDVEYCLSFATSPREFENQLYALGYCFACGEHGDVIDFVGKLFQLSPYDAARKLMADFHLSPDKPPSAAALHAKRIRTEAQQLMENERLCFSVLSDYARVLRDWKVRYAPRTQDEPLHEQFIEACRNLDQTEYYLDILCAGNSHERAKVVQQQVADGKLDRLRRRLEEIHKEELEDGYDTAGVA